MYNYKCDDKSGPIMLISSFILPSLDATIQKGSANRHTQV